MSIPQLPLGTLISGDSLMKVLNEPDYIFRNGSWTKKNIQGAGYDLRLAGDCLVYPAAPGESKYLTVTNNGTEVAKITLAPGDSALVSTIEKVCFDRSVAGAVGPKFSLASKGLLMLNGNAVHPGYGRSLDLTDGYWHPEGDVRLHFVITNIGPRNITLHSGDAIAHLRLYAVESIPSDIDVRNQKFDALADELFGGGSIYFRVTEDLKGEIKETRRRIETIELQATTHGTAISQMKDVTSLIIVFGVFLVASALLGFVFTALVNLFEKLPPHMSSGREALVATFATLYGVSCTTGALLVVIVIWRIVRRMTMQEDSKI